MKVMVSIKNCPSKSPIKPYQYYISEVLFKLFDIAAKLQKNNEYIIIETNGFKMISISLTKQYLYSCPIFQSIHYKTFITVNC